MRLRMAEKSFDVMPEEAGKFDCRKTNFSKCAPADLPRWSCSERAPC
jgi:hypothetical protein